MRFRNPLNYLPAFLSTAFAICIGVGGYVIHKDFEEIGDGISGMIDESTFINSMDKLYNQIAVQGSTLISQLESINSGLEGMHGSLQDIHEEFVSANTSLDSVASLP